MIHAEPVISLSITALYDEEGLSNYEVIEFHYDKDEEIQRIQNFFIDKKDMKQYIKNLIRSL